MKKIILTLMVSLVYMAPAYTRDSLKHLETTIINPGDHTLGQVFNGGLKARREHANTDYNRFPDINPDLAIIKIQRLIDEGYVTSSVILTLPAYIEIIEKKKEEGDLASVKRNYYSALFSAIAPPSKIVDTQEGTDDYVAKSLENAQKNGVYDSDDVQQALRRNQEAKSISDRARENSAPK